VEPYETYIRQPPDEMEDRIALVLEGIRYGVKRIPGENVNTANVRHMKEFLSFLKRRFPEDRFKTEEQFLPKSRVRTTDRNFIVTVPGQSDDKIVMVAHYDTWAGFSNNAPGADDNTSGEEVLKHYLLKDLLADEAPEMTHVYLFSGSEECGTRGILSQFGLVLGIYLVGYAVSSAQWIYFLMALLFLPLAFYRLGITGTRHFLDHFSDQEKASIRAAIAVDSVGEGRLYILENEMGANFIRALIPYEGSEKVNDMLEEGAHLHGIK